LGVGGREE